MPELLIPPDLQLTRVRGVFKKFIQPQYVDFVLLEDMFEGLETLFDTQGWNTFLKSQKQYSPTAVIEFFNNMGMTVDEELYTTVKAPNDGSRELVTEVHKTLFHFFLKRQQINMPYLMLDLIKQCFQNPKRSMPYVYPMTSLLSFDGIQFTPGELVTLKTRNAYDITTTHRMGYKMVDGRVTRTLKGQESDAEEDTEDDEESEADSHLEPMDVQGGDDGPNAEQVPPAAPQDIWDFMADQMALLTKHFNARYDQLNTRMDALADAQVRMKEQDK
ncbi:hypothetical protein Taro_040418 [Colocasia esculenta]|uniref:Uncharacterized protein n=1 Tax=Colocasia esculenta TaxID=4460 RepID=A0A843WJ08_COLES|nr:hypothetical protein [Colocasia esculenta]